MAGKGACMVGDMHGGGHAWQGDAWQGGMCGGMHGGGACMARTGPCMAYGQ